MIVGGRGSVIGLIGWQWKKSIVFTLAATAVVAGHKLLGMTTMELPTLPMAVVGGALGIFVSFRTNSAYDRWWEGRKLWGRMINTSRHWASQVVAYVSDEAHRQRLVMRHVAYVHALRCLLRQQDPFADDEFLEALPDDDIEHLKTESNLTHTLLERQLTETTDLSAQEHFDEFRLSNLDLSLRHLLDIQGGCERIKKTPMPPGYGFIADRLVVAFSFLFPMSIVGDLHWYTIPINLLVCLSFALISEVGRVLEDPFTMFYNGLPLSAISRMIEVNVRQRIGVPRDELPPMRAATERGILM